MNIGERGLMVKGTVQCSAAPRGPDPGGVSPRSLPAPCPGGAQPTRRAAYQHATVANSLPAGWHVGTMLALLSKNRATMPRFPLPHTGTMLALLSKNRATVPRGHLLRGGTMLALLSKLRATVPCPKVA